MKKTILSAISVCILAGLFLLSGCRQPVRVNPDPDIKIQRDLTADVPVSYDTPGDAYIGGSSSSQIDYLYGSDVPTIAEYAEIVVRGVIQEVTFTSFGGHAYTAVSLAVDECYMGDLEQGDLITVLHMGGYISLRDHIAYYDNAFRFDYPSEEEMENTILHEPNEGEPDPQVGDHNIYFLNPVNPDSSCPAGAYHRTRGAASLFRIESDGETVSRINPDCPRDENSEGAALFSAENNTQPYGNELFSLQELIDMVSV